MARTHITKLVVVLAALSLVATACGSGGDGGEGKKGGQIILAAEQWPECINVVTQCANSSWTGWSVGNFVFPQLMEFDKDGKFVPSPLLDGDPQVEEGPPFKITYKLNKDAVWDDGTPIECDDVEFTWQANLRTTGTLSTTGYDQIESISTDDPKSCVVTWKKPYADWPDVLGGNQEYVLKKDAFQGPDLAKEMATSIPFSGGPWKLQSWSKQQSVFVRNDRYWDKDRVPLLDRMVLVPRTDQDTEINALKAGEVVAIFPQPAPGFQEKMEGDARIKFEVGTSSVFEGIWFNLDQFPVNEKAVREAIFYGVDRQAILDNVISEIVEGVPLLNCGGWVPGIGEWCDQTDFQEFTYQPEKSRQVLQAAGWNCPAGGICSKGGRRLSIKWATVTGNKRREDTQQLVKEQLKAAGIEVTFDNDEAGELFDNRLPKRDFVMAEYAQVASPDPTVTTIYHSKNIPTAANKFAGQNTIGWRNAEADRLMEQSDATVDPDKRLELIRKIGDLVVADRVWLPLYPLPSVTAWRADLIEGPIGDFTGTPPGGFWNTYDWSRK